MRSAVLVAALLVPSGDALSQSPTRLASEAPATRAQTRVDSVRALRSARRAQAEFERVRFSGLPWAEDDAGGGRCDERIGRFCLTYGSEDESDDWVPPPEVERVRDARATLIDRLAEAAAASPGDGWIAGQRVRYLVEAGRPAEAVAAARACAAVDWWCHALEGYARHRNGEYAMAEAAYERALERMSERDRQEWTNLSRILRPGEGGAYARTRGGDRVAAERRFWWLADPLWMDPANDRRTEHLSRWVWDRMQDRARTSERISWGEDLEEIAVRFGLPVGYERLRPKPHEIGPADLRVHYASRAREFMPSGGAVRPDAPLGADTWDLHAPRARTDYAPAYVTHFDSLPHQLAVFRRGPDAVVVAGFEMDRDSVRPADTVDGGLVLAVNDSLPMRVEVRRGRGPAGAVRIAAPLDSAVVSVEAIAPERKRAARARYALSLQRPAEGGVGVSDLLLLADPAARPRTLEDAWPGARSTIRFRPGERIGLYWEVYRTDPASDTLRITMSLARRPAGGLRGIAERIGLGGGGSPVHVRWAEEAGISPILGRAMAVALPARLAPGEYQLELSVRPADGPEVTRTRTIFIGR